MKILWLCNLMIPMVAKTIAYPVANWGGWLEGLAEDLLTQDDVDLGVCFPMATQNQVLSGKVNRLKYYGFPQKETDSSKYNVDIESYLKNILDDFHPDIVHIFGTEYPHALAMTKVFQCPDRTVVNIQGLCSVIARHYYAALPERVLKQHTFRDFLKQDSIQQQRKKFIKRGTFEIQALKNVNHVIGRTTWDRACTSQINPNAKYHFCNETLRSTFYQEKWNLESCERNSIFISQGSYPIKGLHFMLEAMPEILKNYPDAKLIVAGPNLIKSETWKDRLKKRSYWVYIQKLIRKLNLEHATVFTGELNEKQMCEQFLKSNVYVSPSTIENSINSLGEAMILGLPCIASYVGGVQDLLKDRVEGFLYPVDEPYILAYYLCKLLGDDDLALKFSQNAREHALKTHDREENSRAMMNIYKDIIGK